MLLFASLSSQGQEWAMDVNGPAAGKFRFGVHVGSGWAYVDKTHLFNLSATLTIDYRILHHLYIQFAPGYSWLWKWNEHYLTLPVQLRKRFGECISLFAGPALTFDVGHFKDLGVSAGAYVHLNERFALVLSVYTFTLYDDDIDFLYVPVNISYRFSF